jgi:serine protease inhibitor
MTFKWAAMVGIVFEMGIVALLALLPKQSWLFVKAFTFLQYSHYPFLWLLNVASPESMAGTILSALLIACSMALIWACLLLGGHSLVTFALARLGISRRQKGVLGLGAGLLCAAGLVFGVVDARSDKPVPFTPSPAVRAVVAANTALALDIYHNFRRTPGNLFFSPFSISTALGLTYAGARGATEQEVGRAAHFHLGQIDLHPAFGELLSRMDRLEHRRRLSLVSANALWRQQGHSFSNDFLDLARTAYRADAEEVDFKRATKAATSKINAWLEERTRGKIKGMIEPEVLDSNTRLLLCSAIYFKGNWRSQFKVQETGPAPFFISSEKTVSVPMMAQTAEFKIARLDDPPASLLELPYYGGDLSMVIILPEAVEGLAEIESSLTPEKLNSWLARLDDASSHKTCVRIPRFRARQSLHLEPVLRALGMVSAFGPAADFSGMDGTTNLILSHALHQAFVDVNEAGTEAAASTLFEAKSKDMADRFNADHPFLYLIRDHGSGTILFLGRLSEPAS